MQNELTQPGSLLDPSGRLSQVGWSRQQLLDCNLEKAWFYSPLMRPFQVLRMKRWDYYAVFTPQRFFSATIAHLGYAGNIFVYTLDFATHALHEEGLVIPLGSGVELPRNSDQGISSYAGKGVSLRFETLPAFRRIQVDWPSFHAGRGLHAELTLHTPPNQESMTIVIPIEAWRFYYNRKINCLPTDGLLQYGDVSESISPDTALGSLDWGRGVWSYQSYWNWASASGFLADGRRIGLNLGCGFGDTSQATENCIVLDGRIHKLDQVPFDYVSGDYMKPWKFQDNQGRLSLEFVPFVDRTARTDLKIITSEVHQMFGRYSGVAVSDSGEQLKLENLLGFAEEHHARW